MEHPTKVCWLSGKFFYRSVFEHFFCFFYTVLFPWKLNNRVPIRTHNGQFVDISPNLWKRRWTSKTTATIGWSSLNLWKVFQKFTELLRNTLCLSEVRCTSLQIKKVRRTSSRNVWLKLEPEVYSNDFSRMFCNPWGNVLKQRPSLYSGFYNTSLSGIQGGYLFQIQSESLSWTRNHLRNLGRISLKDS